MFASEIVAGLSYKSMLHWFYDFSLCLLLPCAFHLMLSLDPAAITLYTTDIILYAHIMTFIIFKLEFQHDVEIYILIIWQEYVKAYTLILFMSSLLLDLIV